MKLIYQAYDRSGSLVSGAIDAVNATEATERLYADGLYVTTIAAPGGDSAGRSRLSLSGGGKVRNLVAITRQLAILTATGTPVVQALEAVERQLPAGHWRNVIMDVRRRVEEGGSFADALAEHPKCFDAVYRSLVAAGETGGQLPAMLDRLSVMVRKQQKVRNAVMGSLSYPIVLVSVSVVTMVVMLLVVLPRFTELFHTLDAPLPPSTKVLIAVSEALREYWWAALLILGAIVGAATWLVRSEAGRSRLDAALVSAPVVGPFLRSLVTARITRTLGVLLEAKVPLLDALDLTRAAAGNRRYAELLTRAEEIVTHGESISAAFRESPLIAPAVTEAVLTGERSGQVGPILVSLADYLDEDNEVVIKSMMSLIEPFILLGLGVAVGSVAISMFLPLFDLTSAASGGP